MPYDVAIRCCLDNRDRLTAKMREGDPDACVLWNLNEALYDLAEGLQGDMHDLTATVAAIHAAVARRQ